MTTAESGSRDIAARSEHFVRHLTESQNRLYAYVYSLIGDHSRAADVLQETNLVLWRKIDDFDFGRPFLPWALAIARIQVLANVRDRKRSRTLLDPDLAELIADTAERTAAKEEIRRDALGPCLEALSEPNRDLIEKRYFRSMRVAEIAAAVDRTTGAVKVALLRARQHLADCVQRRVAMEGGT